MVNTTIWTAPPSASCRTTISRPRHVPKRPIDGRVTLHGANERVDFSYVLVGVAEFEPAIPSSRTRPEAGRSLKIQRFSSRSRTFVRIRFAGSCGRTCGRRTIGVPWWSAGEGNRTLVISLEGFGKSVVRQEG